jgi:hypothetical protein
LGNLSARPLQVNALCDRFVAIILETTDETGLEDQESMLIDVDSFSG